MADSLTVRSTTSQGTNTVVGGSLAAVPVGINPFAAFDRNQTGLQMNPDSRSQPGNTIAIG